MDPFTRWVDEVIPVLRPWRSYIRVYWSYNIIFRDKACGLLQHGDLHLPRGHELLHPLRTGRPLNLTGVFRGKCCRSYDNGSFDDFLRVWNLLRVPGLQGVQGDTLRAGTGGEKRDWVVYASCGEWSADWEFLKPKTT